MENNFENDLCNLPVEEGTEVILSINEKTF